ncbi:ribosomal RNA adenine dimethylase [Polaribacter sp.]|nr:ribosomal RNA adenine dimethylase [Polaribacter sp.]
MTDKIKFFKEAIRTLKTSGTVMPSSSFLAKKMLRNIHFASADIIVEFGPGNGAITKFILRKLNPTALLICFEINENFYKTLTEIKHSQLIVLKSSAENLEEELHKLGVSEVNYIISSLPLSMLPEKITDVILTQSYQVLRSNGTFTQYQYSLSNRKKLKLFFRNAISLKFEFLNFPPAFIYLCKKVG